MDTKATNLPPKLLDASSYYEWVDKFESFCRFNDVQMWLFIEGEYGYPTNDIAGVTRKIPLNAMSPAQRKEYDAENRAWASIKMCLPTEMRHLCKKFTSAYTLWKEIEKRYAGTAKQKKNKGSMLKRQFAVFKASPNESLEDIINRFYHLLAELENHDVEIDDEKMERFLDSLPPKWQVYVNLMKDEIEKEPADMEEENRLNLEKIIERLRSYELTNQNAEKPAEFAQNPSLYYAKLPESSSSTFETTDLFSDKESSSVANTSFLSTGKSSDVSKSTKAMPMSKKSAEESLEILFCFLSAYGNQIQGKITDPGLWEMKILLCYNM